MKQKKLKLDELKVQSFKTSLNNEEKFVAKGGGGSPDCGMETPEFWCTYDPPYCPGRTLTCTD